MFFGELPVNHYNQNKNNGCYEPRLDKEMFACLLRLCLRWRQDLSMTQMTKPYNTHRTNFSMV